MISSTLIIISAASLALIKAYSLTLKASVIPNFFMQSTFPVNKFNPLVIFPFSISTFKS